ncbi:MAG: TrkA family potassium uptake protein [Acidobacteriota bacterium]|nr:TrkA family potassium uptake protein [Acidobacteriota bacterium]
MNVSAESPKGRLAGLRRLWASLGALLMVMVIGVTGYLAFGYGLLDAVFQTVTTVTTDGFGEVHRFGPGQKVFTIVLVLLGVSTAAYSAGVLIEFFVEGYLGGAFRRRRMDREVRSMQDHVIVCGWGRVGTSIARFLKADQADVVVVDTSLERLATVNGPYVHGDATDEDVLREAGIERAKVLITALNADADNLYVTLTGRSMRPDLFIVSRAASKPAVAKLRQAGADRVVDPQELGGARMAALALQPHVAEFLDVVMHEEGVDFRLEQVEVPAGSPLAGQSLRSARIHDQTGTLVLAMREPGSSFRTNPPPDAQIVAGEVLIVIGDAEQVGRLRSLAVGQLPSGSPSGQNAV